MPDSFKPIINENSEILILGTLPGITSLEEYKYYAYANNKFWDIIYSIFNSEIHKDYEERYEFLLNNKISIWDVLSFAEREGSLDKSIKNEVPNDILGLIEKHPNIKTIILNGTTAEKYFKKYFKQVYSLKKCIRVPSSSPTPGKNVKSLNEKKLDWKKAINM